MILRHWSNPASVTNPGTLQPDAAGKDGAVMKKQVAVVALALGLSLTGGTAMAQEGFKVVDTITSHSLNLIQSALPELTRWGLKLDGYASPS